MRSLPASRCVAFGLLLGITVALGVYGSPASFAPNLAMSLRPLPAFASVPGCADFPLDGSGSASRFVGIGPYGLSRIGAAEVTITTSLPSYMCDPPDNSSANSYWVMVTSSTGNCKAWAQAGWVVTPSSTTSTSPGTPHAYYEASSKNTDPLLHVCDPGPQTEQEKTAGYSHTYQVYVYAATPGYCTYNDIADFYMDNTTYLGSRCFDWNSGTGWQSSQETYVQQNRVGGDSFTNLTWCQQPSAGTYCSFSTALPLANTCQQAYNYRGCLTTHNDNGCYAERQWDGSQYRGFDVWDDRSKNPPGC